MFSFELFIHYLTFMFKNFRTNIYVYQKEYVLKYPYWAMAYTNTHTHTHTLQNTHCSYDRGSTFYLFMVVYVHISQKTCEYLKVFMSDEVTNQNNVPVGNGKIFNTYELKVGRK